MLNYDVVVVGGGAGGISCAWNAAKHGLKTLLIEKNICCGGLMTQGLVLPVMKLNSLNINDDFFHELINYSKKYNCGITYTDGNSGWFNPELIKNVFDIMLDDVSCDVLYLTNVTNVFNKNNKFFLTAEQEMLSLQIETKYLVDGTGNGNIFQKLNLEILKDKEKKQSLSLRFLLSNVDCKKFVNWIMELDKDRNVTTSCTANNQIHFSTACTWDKDWALSPYFKKAIKDGILKETDTSYFQIFSVPYMPNTVAFNCPRLFPSKAPISKEFEISELISEGRKSILRITQFCQQYLIGFENAFISNISDMLGIRESVRVKGKKIFTEQDIVSGYKPENIALASNYPIDVHSDKKNNSQLTHINHIWYLPLECLVSKHYDNLFVVGRCLSAEFNAQAAVRTQANCFSMGEAVAKHIQQISISQENKIINQS